MHVHIKYKRNTRNLWKWHWVDENNSSLWAMLPLRLVVPLLLLFLLPLACPKPRPGHYLIETEDGGEDDSVGDSLDNGNNVWCRYFCIFTLKIFIRSVSTHQHKKQGIWEMDWWGMDSPFAQLLDYWYLLMTGWLDDWLTGSFVDDGKVCSLFLNYKYHMYFVLCGMYPLYKCFYCFVTRI